MFRYAEWQESANVLQYMQITLDEQQMGKQKRLVPRASAEARS